MLPYGLYLGAKEARVSLKNYMARRKSRKEAKRLAKLMMTDLAAKDGKKVDDDAMTESTDVTSGLGDDKDSVTSTSLDMVERPAWWVGEWPPTDDGTGCCGQCENCKSGLPTCEEEEESDEEFHEAREYSEDKRGAGAIRS